MKLVTKDHLVDFHLYRHTERVPSDDYWNRYIRGDVDWLWRAGKGWGINQGHKWLIIAYKDIEGKIDVRSNNTHTDVSGYGSAYYRASRKKPRPRQTLQELFFGA